MTLNATHKKSFQASNGESWCTWNSAWLMPHHQRQGPVILYAINLFTPNDFKADRLLGHQPDLSDALCAAPRVRIRAGAVRSAWWLRLSSRQWPLWAENDRELLWDAVGRRQAVLLPVCLPALSFGLVWLSCCVRTYFPVSRGRHSARRESIYLFILLNSVIPLSSWGLLSRCPTQSAKSASCTLLEEHCTWASMIKCQTFDTLFK